MNISLLLKGKGKIKILVSPHRLAMIDSESEEWIETKPVSLPLHEHIVLEFRILSGSLELKEFVIS